MNTYDRGIVIWTIAEKVKPQNFLDRESYTRLANRPVSSVEFDMLVPDALKYAEEILCLVERHTASVSVLSEEVVETAAQVDFEYGKETITWAEWQTADPDHAEWYRSKIRETLRSVGVGGDQAQTRRDVAVIHYSYGINKGTVSCTDTPEHIDAAVRAEEHRTGGPIQIVFIDRWTEFKSVTPTVRTPR